MTLSGARSIFEKLNAQTHASQLHTDGLTRDSSTFSEKFSKEFITKTVFFSYLRSDANDAFAPVLGEKEHDDEYLGQHFFQKFKIKSVYQTSLH